MDRLAIRDALLYGDSTGNGADALFAEGRSPEKWAAIRNHSGYRDMVQEAVREGERFLATPLRALRFSDYRIFDTTGSRSEYQREYFDRRGRLKTFALLSLIFDEPAYIQALEDTMWAVCDEFSWCLPAAMEGESLSVIVKKEDGGVRNPNAPTVHPYLVRELDRMIDLFAAETGFALVEICSLLEHRLAPLVVHRARVRVKERILDSYLEPGRPFWWETTSINWAAVCAGSTGAAALYLIPDGETLAPVLHRVLDTLARFLTGYGEDGVCTEGLAYWNYGFGFFVYFAELLRQRTGGRVDLLLDDKIEQIALFQHKCYMTGNQVVSFSDGPRATNFQPGLTHFLRSRFPAVESPDFRYRSRLTDDHAHRWAHAVRNFVWSDPAVSGGGFRPASCFLKDAGWLISRTDDGGNDAVFAAKGGHNGEPHNHNDVGSFVLHANGDTFVTDPGYGEYTKAYFGPERYDFFVNGSQGHSVPIVDGRYQAAGRAYGTNGAERAELSDDRDSFELELAGAYRVEHLTGLVRSFAFDKRGGVALTLRDRYTFTAAPSEVIERFVTMIEPVRRGDGLIWLQGAVSTVAIRYDPQELDGSIGKITFKNHQAADETAYCIDLKVRKLSPAFSIEVAFALL